ncbi:hypothetical protein GGTG_03259 [Gaeumannomyces tritici R3-111a-1]|uniref:DNA-directed RNA polymerase III subunit n=1 Tax=Gaeumannomyces tritici (strain R3-111a-1) TaxID=644352 RepID=J3NPQ2_GAET3|nr:hypothetical protein GGTG_03259 [Gaeumannomyces tritici R3-111a-1]EJT78157.1 hypothetical protein GGTG_03259 [Gaeumannomyces tritici R3-111a-1]
MSRGGGRGGGRGGRGGARGSLANVAWANDPNIKADMRPSEVFPEYVVPRAAPLSVPEKAQVSSYLLFREQIHSGPLYTQIRTWNAEPDGPQRTYGQEQVNRRYGVKNKATVDPFFAMPMYSKRLEPKERPLPDLSTRPFMKSFFPEELHATLDGDDTAARSRGKGAKKKVLTLSDVHSLRTAEDIFGRNETAEEQKRRLEALEKGEAGEDENDILDPDDEEMMEEEIDDEYEDSDEGDYNAEAYFDGNDYDDYDEGDDGAEGIY